MIVFQRKLWNNLEQTVDIIMAVYNGERYLMEQIESILTQTFPVWRILVSDDGSTDQSLEIIETYKLQYPDRFVILHGKENNKGVCTNFLTALNESNAQYIMFSDQDDVWLPEKINHTLQKMLNEEQKLSSEMPLLIHTDLQVVDVDLKLISESFFEYQGLNKYNHKLNELLVQNVVTGNTIMINRALANYLQQVPQYAVMHDMWLALVAAAFGKIIFLDEPTVLYRQHSLNCIGAKKRYSWNKIVHIQQIKNNLCRQYKQAAEFKEIYGSKLPNDIQEMLYCYSRFNEMTIFKRISMMKKYHLKKQGIIKQIGQMILG